MIRTRWEAFAVIYALALGANERGLHYLERYPGLAGYLLFAACLVAVFMGGAKILDATPPRRRGRERRRAGAPDRRAGMDQATAVERGTRSPSF